MTTQIMNAHPQQQQSKLTQCNIANSISKNQHLNHTLELKGRHCNRQQTQIWQKQPSSQNNIREKQNSKRMMLNKSNNKNNGGKPMTIAQTIVECATQMRANMYDTQIETHRTCFEN